MLLDAQIPAEITFGLCLRATAGFARKIVLGGYLQRQLAASSRSTLIGVLHSATIFGASHGQEGVARMLPSEIYGLMFRVLAGGEKAFVRE